MIAMVFQMLEDDEEALIGVARAPDQALLAPIAPIEEVVVKPLMDFANGREAFSIPCRCRQVTRCRVSGSGLLEMEEVQYLDEAGSIIQVLRQ
jgi:hypothetical protein